MQKKGSKAQLRAKQDLLSSLETAMRIYGPAKEMCKFDGESFEETTYQPNVAAKVVGLAFLSAVAAWEDFVANVYLGYLSGYPAPNGSLPELRAGKAEDKNHALLLAAGESNNREAERRMRWSSFRWVQSISEVHFKKANPFLVVSIKDIEWLDFSVIIRNRVAHNSDKAKKQFKDSFNKLVGNPKDAPLPNGFSPGWLLNAILQSHPKLKTLDSYDHHYGDLFEGYVSLWLRIAELICPGEISNG
ncbi:hypothetical protein [Azospira inquinata]|uniref:Uncharacterized protein n=1 Tax=Azospira inquinata TaxID=2785627 RepID=A0A975SMW1_9RHOO|nr:hypothetical protein [Azospira inquinata]QWT45382.1 hypothetical protein J8L76_10560 [Azospira inquinata]QWT49288.1 hypothetical protein Azoinq_01320 [Azospira inquinata]